MAVSPGSPQQAHPPPQLPQDPSIGVILGNYLTQFALWCRQGFAAQLKNNVALPGIMLQAYDTPAGTTPKVFLLRVNSAGTVTATPVALGGGGP